MSLTEKKLFLLDMDGTIYLGNRLFDGVLEFLEHVKAKGGRYMYLTNNSSKSVEAYVEKLARLGVPAVPEDFYTSAQATTRYLKLHDYKRLYVVGTNALKKQFRESGFQIADHPEDAPDCLVLGFDTELTFQKLEDACILLNTEIPYVATNPDPVCPTEYGYVPDCGSLTDILENATGRRPVVIGKPKPEMIELAIAQTCFSKEEAILIGDRLYTDIAAGNRAGIDTVFVLSGEGTRADIEKTGVVPTYVFQDIREIDRNM